MNHSEYFIIDSEFQPMLRQFYSPNQLLTQPQQIKEFIMCPQYLKQHHGLISTQLILEKTQLQFTTFLINTNLIKKIVLFLSEEQFPHLILVSTKIITLFIEKNKADYLCENAEKYLIKLIDEKNHKYLILSALYALQKISRLKQSKSYVEIIQKQQQLLKHSEQDRQALILQQIHEEIITIYESQSNINNDQYFIKALVKILFASFSQKQTIKASQYPGLLKILKQQLPLFYKENNSQPKKMHAFLDEIFTRFLNNSEHEHTNLFRQIYLQILIELMLSKIFDTQNQIIKNDIPSKLSHFLQDPNAKNRKNYLTMIINLFTNTIQFTDTFIRQQPYIRTLLNIVKQDSSEDIKRLASFIFRIMTRRGDKLVVCEIYLRTNIINEYLLLLQAKISFKLRYTLINCILEVLKYTEKRDQYVFDKMIKCLKKQESVRLIQEIRTIEVNLEVNHLREEIIKVQTKNCAEKIYNAYLKPKVVIEEQVQEQMISQQDRILDQF